MPIEEFDTQQGYLEAVNAKIATNERFIAYMTGSVVDGTSWCSDCDKWRATIEAKVLKDTKLTVLKGIVPTGAEWMGKNDHPWRTHALLKAPGVPCMVLIENNTVLVRADGDDEFGNDDLLEMFNEE